MRVSYSVNGAAEHRASDTLLLASLLQAATSSVDADAAAAPRNRHASSTARMSGITCDQLPVFLRQPPWVNPSTGESGCGKQDTHKVKKANTVVSMPHPLGHKTLPVTIDAYKDTYARLASHTIVQIDPSKRGCFSTAATTSRGYHPPTDHSGWDFVVHPNTEGAVGPGQCKHMCMQRQRLLRNDITADKSAHRVTHSPPTFGSQLLLKPPCPDLAGSRFLAQDCLRNTLGKLQAGPHRDLLQETTWFQWLFLNKCGFRGPRELSSYCMIAAKAKAIRTRRLVY